MKWPLQSDGRAWGWVEGDRPGDWRSRLTRAAVVDDALAKPQIWLGIDLETKLLDGQRYVLDRGEEGDGNKLQNPNFEGPYTVREAGEVKVCEGWLPWYVHDQTRPEWDRESRDIGKGRVLEGNHAQKIFTSFANHDGGVWQRVDVERGKWYEFTVWLHVWCSNQDNPDVSTGQYHAMAFANGWGHWPEHYATICGKEVLMDQYDTYTVVSVVFQAWADTVSIGVRGKTQNAVKHNDLYIDKAELRQVNVYIDEEPPPSPEPSPEPQPPPTGEVTLSQGTIDEISHATADRMIEQYMLLMSGKWG